MIEHAIPATGTQFLLVLMCVSIWPADCCEGSNGAIVAFDCLMHCLV